MNEYNIERRLNRMEVWMCVFYEGLHQGLSTKLIFAACDQAVLAFDRKFPEDVTSPENY